MPSLPPTRVLVATAGQATRDALVEALRLGAIDIAGAAASAAEAVELARAGVPDVVLIDARIPGDAVTATRQIVDSVRGCRVIALSRPEDLDPVLRILLAGGVGHVVDGMADAEIVEAVRRAARAQASLSADVFARLMSGLLAELPHRSRVANTLPRQETTFRGLIEAAPDAVVIVDRDTRITLVNEQTELLFGYRRQDLLGKPVEVLLPERHHRSHIDHRLRYLEKPRPRPMGTGLDLMGRRANGSEFPADISLSTLQTSEGTLISAFIRDLTERRRAERDLRDLERIVRAEDDSRELMAHLFQAQEEERHRIAGDVHDDQIQTMTSALLRLHVLRASLTDPDHLALLAALEESIQHAIGRLRELVFELHPMTLESEGLAATLRVHLREAERELGWQVRFHERLSEEPSTELGVALYRVALEAIANARKHAHARHVDIVLESRQDGFYLRIGDDGEGFSEEAGPSPGHQGLLSMRERAQLAGGWCRIRSSPGAGCEVEVWVPRGPVEEPPRIIEDVPGGPIHT